MGLSGQVTKAKTAKIEEGMKRAKNKAQKGGEKAATPLGGNVPKRGISLRSFPENILWREKVRKKSRQEVLEFLTLGRIENKKIRRKN